MMINLLQVMIMAIKSKISSRNLIAKDLRTKKYRPRIIKAKKGKGSFKRKNLA